MNDPTQDPAIDEAASKSVPGGDELPIRRRTSGPPGGGLGMALLGLVAGVALAAVFLLDPLGLHPFDERLRGEAGGAVVQDASDEEPLWTCGMHPQVIRDEPGSCPICQMDLTPLELDGSGTETSHAGHDHSPGSTPEAEWACPLHPSMTDEAPGECPICGSALEPVAAPEPSSADEVWTCPMHPEILSHEPGSCPICGMDLVAKEVEAPGGAMGGEGTVVRIDPSVVQTMNVRTALVERRDLERPIRTVGYLEYDQERMVTVTTKYGGWVEAVHVNNVGESVRPRQPLFEIYAPDLVQTQHELLSAVAFAQRLADGDADVDALRRAEALVDAARTRLRYWDVSDEQIARLEASGEVFRTLTVKAPSGGVVMKRMPGLEGMAAQPGMEAYHLADLSSLWLVVELFEDQIAWIREGTPAEVELAYFPGETFEGRVRYLEPELSERTRTLRVKIAMPNPEGRLRTGMYATVVFRPQAATAVLAVPSEAVLRTGERQVAVVDLGGGAFAPRQVTLGHEADGWVEVRSGLDVDERVVTSAQFLLDSEASVREAIAKMLDRGRESRMGEAGHVH